ncbi:hypothetical protein [Desulfosarcina ovata]|uniref:Uncharacterized protein n=1 Tax=Desulfosarcina ovata subsp. ovata TaxID=2752305 RepID=A0A5K8A9T8_9BACT|nr:hypothetical protein [Desulfosarcina ovata]BBO89327.1 hypothetical protein DSCOOX_25070 [Desulfosarcina ovata subsp. ovata]
MAYARKYETYEVRELLKGAEGVVSPVTGQDAHSRILHAKSIHGGEGVTDTDMLDRVTWMGSESKNAFKKRGGKTLTSAFPNLILQGSAATQALNSTAGQNGLAVFDSPAHTGKKLRLFLKVANIKEHGFLPETTAPSVVLAKGGKKKNTSNLGTGVTTGVVMIVDRGMSEIHIQTCYPNSQVPAQTSWSVTDMATKVKLASG